MDAQVVGDDVSSRAAADGGGLWCRDARARIGEYGSQSGDSLQGEGGGGAEEIKEGKLALGLQN
jgi:hypothetical protein